MAYEENNFCIKALYLQKIHNERTLKFVGYHCR